MAKQKDNGQATLVDELPAPPTSLPTIELPTAHHFAITRKAIEERQAELKKLASKTDAEGYPREARTIRSDAQALEEDVLPKFAQQGELPMATQADVASGIKDAIRGPIFKHVLVTDDEGEVDHRTELRDAIGDKMARYVLDVAGRAFNAGMQARETTPESLAVKGLPALYES